MALQHMEESKRIFLITDLKDDSPKSVRVERRRWLKGFIRLGHDVQWFSYDCMLRRFSFRHSRRLSRYFGRGKVDSLLVEQVKHYRPHIVFVHCMGQITERTVSALRNVAPDAVFVGRDNDLFQESDPVRLTVGGKMDIVVATNAGRFLRTYKEAGAPLCAFVPNPCDPDIQRPYEVDNAWKSDIIFTGVAEHSKLERGIDRYDLLLRLSKMPNVRLYGCFGNPTIDGIDCFYALSGANIALSINTVNDVRLCHSDRLVNCLACGTFTLAKRVPDSNLLFQDYVHLRYFDTADEFFDLADYYLKNKNEREKIARAGMERAHTEFNCTKISQYVLDLVERGTYDAPWAEIL